MQADMMQSDLLWLARLEHDAVRLEPGHVERANREHDLKPDAGVFA
jgi:hypothetical protein